MITIDAATTETQFREMWRNEFVNVCALRLSHVDTVFFGMSYYAGVKMYEITVRETVITETCTSMSKLLKAEMLGGGIKDEAVSALWAEVVKYKKFVKREMYPKD